MKRTMRNRLRTVEMGRSPKLAHRSDDLPPASLHTEEPEVKHIQGPPETMHIPVAPRTKGRSQLIVTDETLDILKAGTRNSILVELQNILRAAAPTSKEGLRSLLVSAVEKAVGGRLTIETREKLRDEVEAALEVDDGQSAIVIQSEVSSRIFRLLRID